MARFECPVNDPQGGSKAQGMVEFALILPVLLLVVMGIVEFGRMLLIYASVATASREAVRYGSAAGSTPAGTRRYLDCAGMRDAARRMGSLAGIQDADIIIQYDHGPGTLAFASCPASSPDDITGGVDRVVVQVSAVYAPIVPLVPVPTFTIASQSARTVIKNIQVGGNTATPGGGGGAGASSTPTAIQNPTATATPETSPPTATATTIAPLSTLTPTSTPAPPPEEPLFEAINWTKNGNKCQNISFSWSPDATWLSYPGYSPAQYQVYKNGVSQGLIDPQDPNATTWNTGISLNNNATVTLAAQAVFSGGLGSEILSKTYQCDKGNLVEQ